MPAGYVKRASALTDIYNLPTAAGLAAYGAGIFLNADGTPRLVGPLITGKTFYLDPVNGSATNDGRTPGKAFSTLALAKAACTTGKNDVIVLIGNGASAGSARVSAATTWALNATHMIGVAAPSLFSQRARIAPTAAVTAFTPLLTVSGDGNLFENLELWHGFDTGMASQICLAVTGSRNVFRNCHIAGMGDAASAADAGSRCVTLSTGGENLFEDCVIGVDTATRTAANASIELLAGTARNVFRRCIFPFYCTATSPLAVLTAAASAFDRFCLFDDCLFIAYCGGGGSAPAGLATLAAGSGGYLLFKDCMLAGGIIAFGTAAGTRSQIYILGANGTTNTAGIATTPAA